jgi:hypothetical protein
MRIKKTGKPAKQDNTRVKKPLDPAIIKLLEARKELSPGLTSDLIQLARQSPKYLQILENLISVYDSAQDISEDNIK